MLDRSGFVESFIKNDRLGFFITYNYRGIIRKYYLISSSG